MSEFTLTASTALPVTTPLTIGSVTLSPRDDIAIASLAQRAQGETALNLALSELIGAPLPGPALYITKGNVSAYWSGNGQWLLTAPYDDGVLSDQIKERVKDAGSVTEQSDGWVIIDLEGTGCLALLERLCNLNLSKCIAPHVSRTVIEHIGVFLAVQQQGQSYRLFGPRSSAESLFHAVKQAAISIA